LAIVTVGSVVLVHESPIVVVGLRIHAGNLIDCPVVVLSHTILVERLGVPGLRSISTNTASTIPAFAVISWLPTFTAGLAILDARVTGAEIDLLVIEGVAADLTLWFVGFSLVVMFRDVGPLVSGNPKGSDWKVHLSFS
jgi:hypothetical protein